MRFRTFCLFVSAVSGCYAQRTGEAAQFATLDVLSASAEEAAAGPISRPPVVRPRPRRRLPALPVFPSAAAMPSATGVAPEPAGAAPAVTMNGFPAVMDDQTASPPDATGAVGPQHVVTMLNSRVQFQTRTGTVLAGMTLEKFWSGLPSTDVVTDPRILYDPVGKHWLASAVTIVDKPTSALLIGASMTADPTGKWNLFRIPVDPDKVMFGDYDVLGFNGNWVTASIDVFKGPEYQPRHCL